MGAIGNSGHNTAFMQKTAGEWDAWDVIMFPYNFAHRRAEDFVVPAAQARDVGVAIMLDADAQAMESQILTLTHQGHSPMTKSPGS